MNDECAVLLKTEGLKDSDIEQGGRQWVAKDENGNVEGFYVWRMEHGFPYLVHFVTARDKRNPNLARKLLNHFRSEIKELGFKKVILSVKYGLYLEKLVEKYFKVKPYAENGGQKFYLVMI